MREKACSLVTTPSAISPTAQATGNFTRAATHPEKVAATEGSLCSHIVWLSVLLVGSQQPVSRTISLVARYYCTVVVASSPQQIDLALPYFRSPSLGESGCGRVEVVSLEQYPDGELLMGVVATPLNWRGSERSIHVCRSADSDIRCYCCTL